MTTNECTRCNGRGFIWWAGYTSIEPVQTVPIGTTKVSYWQSNVTAHWTQEKRPCKQCQKEATHETN